MGSNLIGRRVPEAGPLHPTGTRMSGHYTTKVSGGLDPYSQQKQQCLAIISHRTQGAWMLTSDGNTGAWLGFNIGLREPRSLSLIHRNHGEGPG